MIIELLNHCPSLLVFLILLSMYQCFPSHILYSMHRQDGNLTATLWMDSKPVAVLSTAASPLGRSQEIKRRNSHFCSSPGKCWPLSTIFPKC